MYRLQFIALCFLGFSTSGFAGPASFITPCKHDDSACLKSSVIAATPYFIKGIPELDIPPADPIVINDVRADDKDLKLGFRNMKLTGISKCQLVDFTRDVQKSTMTLVEDCPLIATGQYDLNGKLLFIQAEGDGDFVIKTDKTRISVTIKVKDVEKDGEKYWKITGFDYKYDLIEKASITLNNLYGGDETRAKPIREVLENNPTKLIDALGGPIIEQLLSKEVSIVNKFFLATPKSQLELS